MPYNLLCRRLPASFPLRSGREGREGHAAGQALLQAEAPAEIPEVPAEAPAEYRSMQTQEIMNQIVEYMKINVTSSWSRLIRRLPLDAFD